MRPTRAERGHYWPRSLARVRVSHFADLHARAGECCPLGASHLKVAIQEVRLGPHRPNGSSTTESLLFTIDRAMSNHRFILPGAGRRERNDSAASLAAAPAKQRPGVFVPPYFARTLRLL